MSAHARRARSQGLEAEREAESFLVRKGFHPLARNHVCRGGELDLVMQDGDTIVFVEVKRRRPGGRVDPLESITLTKRRRILRAATDWASRADALEKALRFDVVSVFSSQEGFIVEHLPDAFDASDAE